MAALAISPDNRIVVHSAANAAAQRYMRQQRRSFISPPAVVAVAPVVLMPPLVHWALTGEPPESGMHGSDHQLGVQTTRPTWYPVGHIDLVAASPDAVLVVVVFFVIVVMCGRTIVRVVARQLG